MVPEGFTRLEVIISMDTKDGISAYLTRGEMSAFVDAVLGIARYALDNDLVRAHTITATRNNPDGITVLVEALCLKAARREWDKERKEHDAGLD